MFYLGTHEVRWLEQLDVPLFISHRRLSERVALPKARAPWVLDSGGFTEISTHGRWTFSAKEYVRAVRRYMAGIGHLVWAASQDWMCEPDVTKKSEPLKTHKAAVRLHQARTIENYLTLKHLAPDIPWRPALQGWEPRDYFRHVEDYDKAGVDLRSFPVVGVGSVCKRQDNPTAENIFRTLAAMGLRLHGFGVKVDGVARYGDALVSSDSMAWSYGARRRDFRMHGCTHTYGRRTKDKSKIGQPSPCNNCQRWALHWRELVLAKIGTRKRQQTDLFFDPSPSVLTAWGPVNERRAS